MLASVLTTALQGFEPIERDGTYKWLRPEYPGNYEQLKRDYGVEIVDGELVALNGRRELPVGISFEYSCSLA